MAADCDTRYRPGIHWFAKDRRLCTVWVEENMLHQACNTVLTQSRGECVCVCVGGGGGGGGKGWPDALLPFSGIICLKLSTLSSAK